MNSETPSILELIAGSLVLLLLTAWLIGGAGHSGATQREGPKQGLSETAAVLREEATQQLEERGVPRAAGWPLSYFIGSDVVTKDLLPGITVGQALLLYKAFPRFTTEWNGLWRLIWRGKSVQYMLAPAHKDWRWSDLLAGLVWIGMPAEQVLVTQGQPDTVNRTITAQGTLEQWVYEDGEYAIILPDMLQEPTKLGTLMRLDALGSLPTSLYPTNISRPLPASVFRSKTFYLYFEHGILVSIQD